VRRKTAGFLEVVSASVLAVAEVERIEAASASERRRVAELVLDWKSMAVGN